MKGHPRAALAALICLPMLISGQMPTRASAAGGGLVQLTGHVPIPVARGTARLVGHHATGDTIRISVGLQLRDQAGLAQLVADRGNPLSPNYGHWLTQEQANASFNPTALQEKAVSAWLQAGGLTIARRYANHLLVYAQGSTQQIEQLLHVTINDYEVNEAGQTRGFYSIDREPSVDLAVAGVVQSIVGLDSYTRLGHLNGVAHNAAPYYPQDFANAYDLNPLWAGQGTGAGQHIAIILDDPPAARFCLPGLGTGDRSRPL